MPNYQLVDVDQLEANLKLVADAIRAKGGTQEELSFPDGFVVAVEEISNGDDLTIMEDVPVELDFSDGDQTVSFPDGYVSKSLVIKKPESLIAENIVAGEVIAGVEGINALKVGDGLKLDAETNILSVDTAKVVEKDNTKPVESAAVHTVVGNINVLLEAT